MQCKVVDLSVNEEVKLRGKQLTWMFSPKRFFFFFNLFKVPLSLNLYCPKREKEKRNGTLWRWWKALLWHIVIMALGTTRLYLSVFVQESETAAGTDSPHSEKRNPGWQGWALAEMRWEREYRWKTPRMIRFEIFMITYDVLMSEIAAVSCEFLMKDF